METISVLPMVFALAFPLVTAFCSMLGGRSNIEIPSPLNLIKNRVWGRWVAPLLLSLGVLILAILIQWSWWYALFPITIKLATHMGHGGDTFFEKLIRRAFSSLVWSLAALPLAIGSGSWIIYASQVIISLIVCTVWGIANPLEAPKEEYGIAFCKTFLMPLMVI